MQQEPILFAGTILFNIQCGKESATRQEAKQKKCKTEAASEG